MFLVERCPEGEKEPGGLPDVSRLAHERVHLIDGEAARLQFDHGGMGVSWLP
jgi:hypothetical protein